jgi:hypothetical protein
MHIGNPRTDEELKETTKKETRRIPTEMLKRVVHNFNIRLTDVR